MELSLWANADENSLERLQLIFDRFTGMKPITFKQHIFSLTPKTGIHANLVVENDEWSIVILDTPLASNKCITRRNASCKVLDGDAHAFMKEMGYTLSHEYLLSGFKYGYKEITISFFRAYDMQDNVVGDWGIKAHVDVKRTDDAAAMAKGHEQLKHLQQAFQGSVDFIMPERNLFRT